SVATNGMAKLLKIHTAYTAKIGEWGVLRDSRYKFKGLIDEAVIFNFALLPSQVTAIYEAGPAGVCKPGGNVVIAGAPSVRGHIFMQGTNWLYPVEQWQQSPVFHKEQEQAFQLFT